MERSFPICIRKIAAFSTPVSSESRVLDRIGYANAIYFDTFPDAIGLDPVAECSANIAAVEALAGALDRLRGHQALAAAIAAQDAAKSQRIIQAALFGGQ